MERFWIFLAFFQIITGIHGAIPENETPVSFVDYDGERLPIWESNSIVYTVPQPTLDNISVVADTDKAGGAEIYLVFDTRFTNDKLKHLALNAARIATGKCIELDDIQVAPVAIKLSLNQSALSIQKVWQIWINNTEKASVRLLCASRPYCNIIKPMITASNLRFEFVIKNTKTEKIITKSSVNNTKQAKYISCEMAKLRYLLSQQHKRIIDQGKKITEVEAAFDMFETRVTNVENFIKQGSTILAKLEGATSNNKRGRLLVKKFHDQWGTVCDDHFDRNSNAARVVCKQIYGLSGKGRYYNAPGGSGTVVLDNVQCTGNEHILDMCKHIWQPGRCGHNEDVGVDCN